MAIIIYGKKISPATRAYKIAILSIVGNNRMKIIELTVTGIKQTVILEMIV